MKQLDLKSEAYRYIVQSYGEWLGVLGYNEQTVYQLPIHVQEFLYYAESKGYAGLHQLNINLFKEHYYRLKGRPNKRRGGGLSNSYLNKHLQALQKFIDYLRQSGRLLLPKLDIRTEGDESIITDVLTQEETRILYETTYQPYEARKYDKGIKFYEAMQLRDRAMLAVLLWKTSPNPARHCGQLHTVLTCKCRSRYTYYASCWALSLAVYCSVLLMT